MSSLAFRTDPLRWCGFALVLLVGPSIGCDADSNRPPSRAGSAGNPNVPLAGSAGVKTGDSTRHVGGASATDRLNVGGAASLSSATENGGASNRDPLGNAGSNPADPTSGGTTTGTGSGPAGGTSSAGATSGGTASRGGASNRGGNSPGGASNNGGGTARAGASSVGGSVSLAGATFGGATNSGGTAGTSGIDVAGAPNLTGGTSAGGNTNVTQAGCLLRLGGLPEIAPGGVGDIGDFNGDGIVDVVLGAVSGNNVRVLLGRGNGVYGDAVTYGIDGSARAIAVGDLDGDNILDIATRNSDSANISILKGTGSGTFTLSQTVAAGSDMGSGFPKQNIVLADVTGDGRLDMLTAHWDQTISIAVAMPNGTFNRLSPISIGRAATQLAVADLNNDQVLDIVVNHGYNNRIGVFIGTGGGTFASRVDYDVFSASSWYADSIAIGDVDQDGDRDVVVGNGAGAAVAVMTNAGNGLLSSPSALNVSGSTNYVNNVQFTDLEGDGDLDLLVNVSGDGALYYLWNSGNGQFLTTSRDYVANAGKDIRVGDSNGDGVKDLFLFGDKFLTLLGRGSGKFESQKYLLSSAATNPVSIAVGNFDGTGVMDVALANEATKSDSVFLLGADAVYSVPAGYTVGTKPSFIRAADVTGDNKTDLVTLNQDGTINVLRNSGTGTFTVLSGVTVLSNRSWFDLKDVNEDGALDVIMLGGTSACAYRGTGTGAFGACTSFTVSNGSAMEAMVLGDVNHDGHLDVVAHGNASFYVWLGKGDGTFPKVDFYTSGSSGTSAMALGDLNNDDKLDLVVSSSLSAGSYATLSVWLGNGDGSFTHGTNQSLSGVLSRVQIVDMNRDGKSDVVTVSSENNSLIVLLGNGDGSLDPKYFSFPAGEKPTDLAIADLNGDGWLDVATPGYDSGSAGVLFGGTPVCPVM